MCAFISAPSSLSQKTFWIGLHPTPFLKAPLLRTRAPNSGLSFTLTCNSQSLPFHSILALYSKLLNHGWKIPMRRNTEDSMNWPMRDLWSRGTQRLSQRETSRRMLFWGKKRQEGDVKMTNEADPLRRFFESAFITLVWKFSGGILTFFFPLYFCPTLSILLFFTTWYLLFLYFRCCKGNVFHFGWYKNPEDWVQRSIRGFFVEIKSWTLLVYL